MSFIFEIKGVWRSVVRPYNTFVKGTTQVRSLQPFCSNMIFYLIV
jgi:hypothetical protein